MAISGMAACRPAGAVGAYMAQPELVVVRSQGGADAGGAAHRTGQPAQARL